MARSSRRPILSHSRRSRLSFVRGRPGTRRRHRGCSSTWTCARQPGLAAGRSEIAFVADPEWRNELKYSSPDLWTVTIDGKVTRLTNDGYVYGDVDYSPDGKYCRIRARSAPT